MMFKILKQFERIGARRAATELYRLGYIKEAKDVLNAANIKTSI